MGVWGKGEYGHAVSILSRPTAAFCLLCRRGQSRSPPAGDEMPPRSGKERGGSGGTPQGGFSCPFGAIHLQPPPYKVHKQGKRKKRDGRPQAAPTKEEERGSRPQAAKFPHKKRNNGAPSRRALQKKDTPKEDTLWSRRNPPAQNHLIKEKIKRGISMIRYDAGQYDIAVIGAGH